VRAADRASARSVHGYKIDADCALRRLRPAQGPLGRLSILRSDGPVRVGGAETIGRFPAEGTPILSIERAPGALQVWCGDTGTARIEAETQTITCRVKGEPDAWEDRLVNLLIPLLLADRGEFILHGAAVQTPAGAVIVCGSSGRGKSTLAAVLATQNVRVLTEDAVSLTLSAGGVLVWPGPMGVRLDEGTTQRLGLGVGPTARGKLLHSSRQRGDTDGAPVELVAIASLEPRAGSSLRVTRLTPAAAVAHVFPNMVRLERSRWQQAFDRAAEVTALVDCYTVRLPDDLERLPRIASELLAALTGQGKRSAA
jgi:hypothetical protein